MKRYCGHCDAEKEVRVEQRQEEYPVKGFPITIDATVCVCTECGQPVWDSELDDENLKKAFRVYRQKNNLLMPEEIKQIRQQYGLSQVDFAKVLGLGDKTIARYENGSIQDEAQNNLILLMRERGNFQRLLERQGIAGKVETTRSDFVLEEPLKYSPRRNSPCHYRLEGNVFCDVFPEEPAC